MKKIGVFLGLKFEWNLSVNTKRSGTDYCWLYCGIFYVKNHPNLSKKTPMKNKSLGAHFLLKKFFGNFNSKTTLFTRIIPDI